MIYHVPDSVQRTNKVTIAHRSSGRFLKGFTINNLLLVAVQVIETDERLSNHLAPEQVAVPE